MPIRKFENGSVLVTGDDIYDYLLSGHMYDRNCDFCRYVDEEDSEHCDGCTGADDVSCSCHINPPCSKCENNAFELAENIVDYYEYRNGTKGKKSIKINKDLYNNFKQYEKEYGLSVEILSTLEKAFYVSSTNDDISIEIETEKTLNVQGIEKVINSFLKRGITNDTQT
jgi:hypothetical protein